MAPSNDTTTKKRTLGLARTKSSSLALSEPTSKSLRIKYEASTKSYNPLSDGVEDASRHEQETTSVLVSMLNANTKRVQKTGGQLSFGASPSTKQIDSKLTKWKPSVKIVTASDSRGIVYEYDTTKNVIGIPAQWVEVSESNAFMQFLYRLESKTGIVFDTVAMDALPDKGIHMTLIDTLGESAQKFWHAVSDELFGAKTEDYNFASFPTTSDSVGAALSGRVSVRKIVLHEVFTTHSLDKTTLKRKFQQIGMKPKKKKKKNESTAYTFDTALVDTIGSDQRRKFLSTIDVIIRAYIRRMELGDKFYSNHVDFSLFEVTFDEWRSLFGRYTKQRRNVGTKKKPNYKTIEVMASYPKPLDSAGIRKIEKKMLRELYYSELKEEGSAKWMAKELEKLSLRSLEEEYWPKVKDLRQHYDKHFDMLTEIDDAIKDITRVKRLDKCPGYLAQKCEFFEVLCKVESEKVNELSKVSLKVGDTVVVIDARDLIPKEDRENLKFPCVADRLSDNLTEQVLLDKYPETSALLAKGEGNGQVIDLTGKVK